MYQKERLDSIMALLHRHGYLTVKFLTEELHYSTATVNRDLNVLEQMKQVKRSYGGVEPIEQQSVPLMFRYAKSKPAKKRIGKRAAELVQNGDTVFIDGTTTTQYMGQYLLEKKEIKVITNNMALAIFLAERGIEVVVLGGKVVETPFMLGGSDAVEIAEQYRADKCFFSTGAVSYNDDLGGGDIGYVGMGELYYALLKTMIRNSDQAFFLVDREKVGKKCGKVLCSFSQITGVVSDHPFSAAFQEKFPNTLFIGAGPKEEEQE